MNIQIPEHQKRPTRIITQQQSLDYQKNLKAFEEKFNNEQESFTTSQENTYYIVSIKFLDSWRDFCMNHQEEREIPYVMNEDLFNPDTQTLREGLKEKEDFEWLSPQVYSLFAQFKANELKRRVVHIQHQKRIPLYLNTYKYICITNLDLKHIDQKLKKRQDYKLSTIEQSENATVQNLLAKIAELDENQLTSELRLWRVDKKENLDTLFKYLKAAADRATYQYRIKGFGKKLQPETRIQDLQMEEGDFFVVEVKQKNRKWFLQSDNQKKCEGCYDITELKFSCRCEKVAYCTQECKQKDKKFHLRSCEFAEMEQLNKPIDMSISSKNQNGIVGLRNLGNTCFMNSCLQCLSNTLPLTNYFLKSLFQYQINRSNLLGTNGKLAKSYARFIKGVWCESDTVFTPDGIKAAVSSKNTMFSGYAQHDSQQFFSFLIDGIHQDLNRIQKKPYVQSIESNNRPDDVVALESWLAHMKRNQSIITDLMAGQYKSKVTCPDCGKQSITFDPFITVTLPIPQKVVSTFDGFIIYKNFQNKTKRIAFQYSKANVEDWIKNIAKIGEVDEKQINIYLVSINEGVYKAGRDSLSQIVYKMENQSKNIFAIQMTEEEMAMKNRVQITGRFSKKTYYNDYDNIWFKMPFYFQKQSTTGLTIYKRMLKMLYHQAYNDSKHRSKLFGGKTYEEYEAIMLSKRPFELYLRYGRKLDRFYHRLQYKFEQEMKIQDDITLIELFTKTNEKDCELDVRMTKAGLQYFSFQKLKDFEDLAKKFKTTQSNNSEDKQVELSQCFQNMSESQQLQAGNEWYCSVCKEHKQANKQMSIYKSPKILILHLKRFKQKGLIRKQKNQSRVIFPTELDMKPYLIDSLPMTSYLSEMEKSGVYIPPKYPQQIVITSSNDPIYDLYAVSNHYGGLGGGHYTAYAKNNGKWYDFNDSSVRSVSQSSIVGSGAYILFYKRRD